MSPVRRVLGNVARSASVAVSGRILRGDGSPAAGVVVGLQSELSPADLLAGTALVPLTPFTACLADPPPRCASSGSPRSPSPPGG